MKLRKDDPQHGPASLWGVWYRFCVLFGPVGVGISAWDHSPIGIVFASVVFVGGLVGLVAEE